MQKIKKVSAMIDYNKRQFKIMQQLNPDDVYQDLAANRTVKILN